MTAPVDLDARIARCRTSLWQPSIFEPEPPKTIRDLARILDEAAHLVLALEHVAIEGGGNALAGSLAVDALIRIRGAEEVLESGKWSDCGEFDVPLPERLTAMAHLARIDWPILETGAFFTRELAAAAEGLAREVGE